MTRTTHTASLRTSKASVLGELHWQHVELLCCLKEENLSFFCIGILDDDDDDDAVLCVGLTLKLI